MKIDVIIPTYNREASVKRAIDSVLNQSYKNFFLIIVDDGSTDQTKSLLENYKDHPQIKILNQENRGVSAARNFGISNSNSEWIAFLDSDDEWLPHKLQTQVEFVKKNLEYSFIHSEEIWYRNNVRVNPKLKHSKNSNDLFLRSLEFCLISPSTVLMKRDLFNKYGPFNEDFVVCEDFDLWNKILARLDVGFIETPLINKFGGHTDQLSTQFKAMDTFRIKSLINLFHCSDITKEKKELIRSEIIKKATILLPGYLKHQNLKDYEEVKAALAPFGISDIIN